jgi:hypothetical protein
MLRSNPVVDAAPRDGPNGRRSVPLEPAQVVGLLTIAPGEIVAMAWTPSWATRCASAAEHG